MRKSNSSFLSALQTSQMLHRIFGILYNSQHHDCEGKKITIITITPMIALTFTITLIITITPALAFTITLRHASRPRSRLLVEMTLVIRQNARPEIGRAFHEDPVRLSLSVNYDIMYKAGTRKQETLSIELPFVYLRKRL